MADAYRKVGRGGAGNFYTKEDIEATQQQHEDLEAQKLDSPDSSSHNPSIVATTSPTEPRRTGRGGAGNFVSASELDDNDSSGHSIIEKTKDAVGQTKEKVLEKLHHKPSGYGGRGGAGNWRPTAEEAAQEHARIEEENQMMVRNRAEQDVEAELSRPPGAYLGAPKWSDA